MPALPFFSALILFVIDENNKQCLLRNINLRSSLLARSYLYVLISFILTVIAIVISKVITAGLLILSIVAKPLWSSVRI